MALHSADSCPKCERDLRGSLIPEEHKDKFPPVEYFSKVIGIEYDYNDPEHYDGVSEWMCPFCLYREGRWSGKELKEGESEKRFGV